MKELSMFNGVSGAMCQTSDGGYTIADYTTSFGAGGQDFYVVKTDASGMIPEGLVIGAVVLLSTLIVIVSTRYFLRRPKIEK